LDGEVIEIRAARPEEFEAVGELTVAAYLADGALSATDPYLDVLRDAAARAAGAELLVALDESGTLLGTVTWCPAGSSYRELGRPEEGEFRALAVAPAGRGRGVGTALARHCLNRATAEGFAAVVISSSLWMSTAHRLYRRLGFRPAPDRDWSPRPDIHLLAFVRPLP
jgi:GNAT superfamily N-acetyltransferase